MKDVIFKFIFKTLKKIKYLKAKLIQYAQTIN